LVAERVEKTKGRISAKRLLSAARAAGCAASARNVRRLVAAQKALWRQDDHRDRRPAVWSPGQHLVIDWGEIDWTGVGRLHVVLRGAGVVSRAVRAHPQVLTTSHGTRCGKIEVLYPPGASA
jgi:hypothetical protein